MTEEDEDVDSHQNRLKLQAKSDKSNQLATEN